MCARHAKLVGVVAFVPDPSLWPFAPGEGPFRIKGTGYRGHLEYVEANVPGGVRAMGEHFEDPRLARFFEQPFLAASLYDLHPLIAAAAPCAAILGVTPREFVDRRSRAQAPKDVGGVYRFLLAMVPTRSVARRVPQLFAQVFDFGRADVTRDEAGEVDATFEGIPAVFAPWFGAVFVAYGEAALVTSGAKRGAFAVRGTTAAGSAHGVPLVRMAVEIRWS